MRFFLSLPCSQKRLVIRRGCEAVPVRLITMEAATRYGRDSIFHDSIFPLKSFL